MANLGSLGSLFVDLAANTATFESDMGRAARISERQAKEIGKRFDEMGKRVGIALAATAAVVAAGVTKAIRDADELGKVAQKTAIAVESLSKLKFAASMEDVDFGSLESALIKFNKAQVEAVQGSKDQAAAFAAVGVSLEDLKSLKPDELLLRVADAFAAARDDASKTTLATALFGKSGADLIPLLNKGSAAIREQGEVLKRLGGVITNDLANSADSVGDNFDLAKTAVDGLFVKLATDLSPEIANITKLIADEKFQNGVANLVRDVSDFTLTLVRAAPELFRLFAAFRGAALGYAAGTPFGPMGQAVGTLIGAGVGEFSPEILRAALPDRDGFPPATRELSPADRTKQMTGLSLSINAVQSKINSGESFKAGTLEADAKALEALTNQYKALAGPVAEADKRSLGYADAQDKAAKKVKEAKLELDDHAQALIEADERYRELGKTLTQEVMTPVETYTQQMDQLDDALAQGVISQETYARQVTRTASAYVDASLAQSQAAEEAARSIALETAALAELERTKADRAIRNDPTARVFGIDSLEELEQRSDGMKAAALQMGDALNNAFSNAGDSLSGLITNMVLFGDKGEFSVKKVAAALVQDTVQGFVQVGIQMIANEALASLLGKKRAAESVVEGTAIAGAYAPAAAATSIATFGQSALIGLAAVIGTLAATRLLFGGGRANGGPAYAGGLFEVGEMNRPELAYFNGKQYLIPGNQGGMVKPLDAGARSVSGGGGFTGVRVINPPGVPLLVERAYVERGELVTVLRQATAAAEAKQIDDVRRGRGIGAAVGEKYGVAPRQQRSRA